MGNPGTTMQPTQVPAPWELEHAAAEEGLNSLDGAVLGRSS